jgi:hypothetical protein
MEPSPQNRQHNRKIVHVAISRRALPGYPNVGHPGQNPTTEPLAGFIALCFEIVGEVATLRNSNQKPRFLPSCRKLLNEAEAVCTPPSHPLTRSRPSGGERSKAHFAIRAPPCWCSGGTRRCTTAGTNRPAAGHPTASGTSWSARSPGGVQPGTIHPPSPFCRDIILDLLWGWRRIMVLAVMPPHRSRGGFHPSRVVPFAGPVLK